MLDFCLAIFCAFNPLVINQAGLIIFNQHIEVMIPLGPQNVTSWKSAIENIRSKKLPTSCCTPTGEAFDLATSQITQFANHPDKIAFVITDGVPSNNFADSVPLSPWVYYNAEVGFSPSEYNYNIVPARAAALKKVARLMMVGVPDALGHPPDINYFRGIPNPALREPGNPDPYIQCITRQATRTCSNMSAGAFPIVTAPVDQNSFSSPTFNVTSLVHQTLGAVCNTGSSKPTKSPSKGPPTNQPTPGVGPMRQVDLYFLLDHSFSMNQHAGACQSALNKLPPPVGPVASWPCWELIWRYTLSQATNVAEMCALCT